MLAVSALTQLSGDTDIPSAIVISSNVTFEGVGSLSASGFID